MMEHYPAMDIQFPPAREKEMYEEMIHLATLPWSPQEKDALGREVKDGYFYFHRDA